MGGKLLGKAVVDADADGACSVIDHDELPRGRPGPQVLVVEAETANAAPRPQGQMLLGQHRFGRSLDQPRPPEQPFELDIHQRHRVDVGPVANPAPASSIMCDSCWRSASVGRWISKLDAGRPAKRMLA